MKILYVLSAMFPYGRAYATRALNICRSLKNNGNDVDIIADYISDKSLLKTKKMARFENMTIYLSSSHAASERNIVDKVFAPTLSSIALTKYLKTNQPDCVILSSAHDRFHKWVSIFKHYDIPIVLESCEWFDYYNFKFGKLNFRYHQFLKCWNNYFPRAKGVIAISRLIEQHYQSLGVPTIRIPGLCNPDEIYYKKERRGEDKTLNVVFEGDIFCGKDDIFTFIEAISEPALRKIIRFHIFGPSKKDIEKHFAGELPSNVIVHGFINHDLLEKELKKMDYGLIIRPNRRSSHAGFPTKLVDYFTNGLPVISNLTGDIGLYLNEGENGFVIDFFEKNEIKDSILELFKNIKINLYERMSMNASLTAKKYFDYNVYSKKLESFIKHIVND